jgi:hypothetical protein
MVAQWTGISLNPGEGTRLCLSSASGAGEFCVFANQESQSSVEMNECSGSSTRMKQFTLVFKGDLGEEKNIAVAVATYQDCGSPPV